MGGGMGGRGGGHVHAQLWGHFQLTGVTSIDSSSQFLWSFVWNEWDYKLHNHSFHTKDQRNWDGLSIDVTPVNQKWHHSCTCAWPPSAPPWHRTLTFTLLLSDTCLLCLGLLYCRLLLCWYCDNGCAGLAQTVLTESRWYRYDSNAGLIFHIVAWVCSVYGSPDILLFL